MEPLETFFRPGNIKFYLALGKSDSVRGAATAAGLSFQHAHRLLLIWRERNWVQLRGTLHGIRYVYTDEGKLVKDRLFLLGWFS